MCFYFKSLWNIAYIIDNFQGTTSANGKAPEKSGKTSEPVQKRLKKKSIFSPENSSESESEERTTAKVSAIKSTSSSTKCSKNPPAKAKMNDIKQKSAVTSRPGE